MRRGVFITMEGPDGSGKTTQLALLAASLRALGHPVVTLRQPGGTALGDRLRALLLSSRSEAALGPIDPHAELALMFADRAQSIAEHIAPALAAGSVVLCDRFTDSSEAYQGAGRGLGANAVLALHAALCDGLQPDLTLLLLPPMDVALARARQRNLAHAAQPGPDENRFEQQDAAFFARVYAGYRAIAAREPGRVHTFPESLPIPDLAAAILATVLPRIETRAAAPTPAALPRP